MVISRTYLRESLIWIAGFVLAMEASGWLATRLPADSPVRLLALAPVILAMCGAMWVELRLIARMDELQRLTYLIATLSGAMLGMLFCAIAFIGEALKLWERVAPIYTIAAMGVGFVIGLLIARRRYG